MVKINKETLVFNQILPVYLENEKNELIGAFIDVVAMNKSDIKILNFTGNSMNESIYDIVMGFLSNIDQYDVIVTDSDVLARKEYLPLLLFAQSHDIQIVFFYSTIDKRKNITEPKCIFDAHNSLISSGIESVFCQSFSELKTWFKAKYDSELSISNASGEIRSKNEKRLFDEVTIRKIPKLTLIKTAV